MGDVQTNITFGPTKRTRKTKRVTKRFRSKNLIWKKKFDELHGGTEKKIKLSDTQSNLFDSKTKVAVKLAPSKISSKSRNKIRPDVTQKLELSMPSARRKTTKKFAKPPEAKVAKGDELDSNWKKFKRKDKNDDVVTERSAVASEDTDVWFEKVDPILLETDVKEAGTSLEKSNSYHGLTKIVAIDCEMVGVGAEGRENSLARVSIVNHFGHCVYDKFVKSREPVTDYRTFVSGVTPHHLKNAANFDLVQNQVNDILNNRVLVGHSLKNDLKVLFLDHPKTQIRDTSTYRPFRMLFSGKTPSLKNLTEKLLGVRIQSGRHSSVEDAQAAMKLYVLHRKQWERSLKSKRQERTPSTAEVQNHLTLDQV